MSGERGVGRLVGGGGSWQAGGGGSPSRWWTSTRIIVSSFFRVHAPCSRSSRSVFRLTPIMSLSRCWFLRFTAFITPFSLFERKSASSASSVHMNWMPSSETWLGYLCVNGSIAIVSQSIAAACTTPLTVACIASSKELSQSSICGAWRTGATRSTDWPSPLAMRITCPFLSKVASSIESKTDERWCWMFSGFEPCERISNNTASETK